MLPIKILMQAVVVADTVLKKQWSWAYLTGSVAALNEVRVFIGIANFHAHRLVPLIGNGSQFAIEGSAQSL
jgi:hypothetical protein